MRRALLYVRISADIAGTELGVTRQREDAEKLCAGRGWEIAATYADNDLSAHSGVHRPGYTALLAAVERGDGDVVVVYQLSRLWRNRRERAEGIDLLKARQVSIISVKGPDLDLSTAYGRAMAGLLGEFDTMESEVKAERVRSKIEQSARAGAQMAGGNRPYGYAPAYRTVSAAGEKLRRRITAVAVDETEAEIIRECAKRVLAGESLHSIAADLNRRDVLTSVGKQWQSTTLRRLLCSARISGRREYTASGAARPLCGEIVCDSSEWPSIITPEISDRLREQLTRPERRTATIKGTRKLLSGILRCGRCGYPMVSRPRAGVPRYCCNPDTGHGDACGRCYVDAAKSDDHVRDLVLAALDSPAMTQRLAQRDAPPGDLHARIRTDEDALAELAADHGAGEISRAEWKAARAPIAARLEVVRAQLAATTQTNALEGFVGPLEAMADRWEHSNTSQRRAVITAVLEKVLVHPARRGGNRFDTDRLEPVWLA